MASGRLRLGYTFNCVMLYVTGGVAVQDTSVDTDISVATSSVFTGPEGLNGFVSQRVRSSDDQTMVGYTAGAGLEWQVVPWARLGVEYRFSHFDDSFGFSGGSTESSSIGNGSSDVEIYNHQVTVRVNIPFSTFFGSR
jgi:opacity protein-like surface antigen